MSNFPIQPLPSQWQDKIGHRTHIWNLGRTHTWKPWSLSLGCDFSTRHWYQFPPKRALSHQALKSASWCITRSLCPLMCQKLLSLPSLTGLGSCFAWPWIDAHLLHWYPADQPTIFPTSSSCKFSNFSSPTSKKVSLQGKGDTCQPKLLSGRDTTDLLLFSQNLSLPTADLWV